MDYSYFIISGGIHGWRDSSKTPIGSDFFSLDKMSIGFKPSRLKLEKRLLEVTKLIWKYAQTESSGFKGTQNFILFEKQQVFKAKESMWEVGAFS